MRKFTWLIAAGLAAGTTGCIETMDGGYAAPSYGYNGGYYSRPAYYQPVPVNNYYYSPTPPVVTRTRYVPVPAWGERGRDRRWDGDHDGDRRWESHRDGDHRWDGHRGAY